MRKLFLCGRSEAGKTSLTQALKGEQVHYQKTQYVKTWDITIDTPGEYAETKTLAMALGIFSFDSDVVGLLCGADEPYNLFDPAQTHFTRFRNLFQRSLWILFQERKHLCLFHAQRTTNCLL